MLGLCARWPTVCIQRRKWVAPDGVKSPQRYDSAYQCAVLLITGQGKYVRLNINVRVGVLWPHSRAVCWGPRCTHRTVLLLSRTAQDKNFVGTRECVYSYVGVMRCYVNVWAQERLVPDFGIVRSVISFGRHSQTLAPSAGRWLRCRTQHKTAARSALH